MRGWWIGAALLAVSWTAHAQQAVQNAPTADTPTATNSPATPKPARRRSRMPPSTASPITDHVALNGIFFLGKVSTTGRIDNGNVTEGTPFNAEQDLGLSNGVRQAMVELMFRLVQRNRLRLDFIDLGRTGQATLASPLQYGDELFQAHQVVSTELDWRETDFTYTYSFLRGDHFELGVGPGLHLVQAYANAQVPNTAERETYSAAGPLATAALDGTWRFARHWSLNVRGQYMHLAIQSTSGMLGIYHADLQYRWRANFAVGAGYESRRIQVDIRNQNPSGFVQMNISGPELFLRVAF